VILQGSPEHKRRPSGRLLHFSLVWPNLVAFCRQLEKSPVCAGSVHFIAKTGKGT
jgi:hypothetical protein